MPHKKQRKNRGRGALILLVVVIILALAGYFAFGELFEFTPEGVRFAAGSEDSADFEYNPANYDESTDSGPRVSIDMGELPPQGAGALHGKLMDAAGKSGAEILALAENLRAQGYDTAVVPLKTATGERLTAVQLQSVADACNATKLRFVAYISAFRDDVTAREVPELAATDADGAIFTDTGLCAWLNPYADGAFEYVLESCRMAADAGANEILLDNFYFPVDAGSGIIDYGEPTLTRRELIADYTARLAEAIPIRIGVVLHGDDTLGEGASEEKGQDTAVFAAHFGRFWVYAEDAEDAQRIYRRSGGLNETARKSFAAIVGGEYDSTIS